MGLEGGVNRFWGNENITWQNRIGRIDALPLRGRLYAIKLDPVAHETSIVETYSDGSIRTGFYSESETPGQTLQGFVRQMETITNVLTDIADLGRDLMSADADVPTRRTKERKLINRNEAGVYLKGKNNTALYIQMTSDPARDITIAAGHDLPPSYDILRFSSEILPPTFDAYANVHATISARTGGLKELRLTPRTVSQDFPVIEASTDERASLQKLVRGFSAETDEGGWDKEEKALVYSLAMAILIYSSKYTQEQQEQAETIIADHVNTLFSQEDEHIRVYMIDQLRKCSFSMFVAEKIAMGEFPDGLPNLGDLAEAWLVHMQMLFNSNQTQTSIHIQPFDDGYAWQAVRKTPLGSAKDEPLTHKGRLTKDGGVVAFDDQQIVITKGDTEDTWHVSFLSAGQEIEKGNADTHIPVLELESLIADWERDIHEVAQLVHINLL